MSNSITIDRNKISLAELFELHVFMRPGFNMAQRMKARQIAIGETPVDFVAQETVTVNGVLLIWNSKAEWLPFTQVWVLGEADTLHITIHWENF